MSVLQILSVQGIVLLPTIDDFNEVYPLRVQSVYVQYNCGAVIELATTGRDFDPHLSKRPVFCVFRPTQPVIPCAGN